MDNHVRKKKYGDFVSISSLTGECAAEKIKNFCISSLWTCLHHMVILRSQNKITDFFMILAWASPFNRIRVNVMLTVIWLDAIQDFPDRIFSDKSYNIKEMDTQQIRGIRPMLFQCWPTVFDAGPTLKQHWVNAPCLLGYM